MVAVPSASDRVSRWTPVIIACALINFGLAQLLIVVGASWPATPEMDVVTLAAVHLLTIGWMTLLMFGALFQFVPVLTGGALGDQRLSLATLLLAQFGLAGMVAGFVLLGVPSAVLLPSGGGLVILGVLAGSFNIAVPFAREGRRPLSAWFIVAGIALLVLTITLGLTFALALTVPQLAWALGPIVAAGLEYHVLAGIGGWFTLTAIGVSYELLPMFMLAPHAAVHGVRPYSGQHAQGCWSRWRLKFLRLFCLAPSPSRPSKRVGLSSRLRSLSTLSTLRACTTAAGVD